MRDQAQLKATVDVHDTQLKALDDAGVLLELADEAKDEATAVEATTLIEAAEAAIGKLEFARMLSGPYDREGALLTINAGAGGTESQDWAEMLLRMYTRWAQRKGYKTESLDLQAGDEAGIKSATISIEGEWAYGWLRAEAGVHRLVRISPYDANARRHTSFASVFIYPDIDETIKIEIDEKDLRIDVMRSGGAGGQHVNKTESAVRITHLPTNIVVQCQNDRSQHRNRAEAGVHRLVRISPFDSAKRRHTSFASAFIYPDIDETITIEIDDKDLRVDVMRSGGAGGQHVNKTESAVRLTHIPTGIAVHSDQERSQHKNKAVAMRILKAKLFEVEQKKQEEKMGNINAQKKAIEWGSQIRSYVLAPYQMVKDLRTEHEVGNAIGTSGSCWCSRTGPSTRR